MKKEFNIVGLDCGNCALTLEKYLQKIPGMNDCQINFSTSKLYVDIDDTSVRQTLKEMYKTAKQVNPSVTISNKQDNDNNGKIVDIILYVVGLLLGVCALIIDMPVWLYYPLIIVGLILMGYKTLYLAIYQLKNLKINENTLITLSVVGAMLLGEHMEGVMVIALYTFGKILESKAVNYSRKSIASLISIQPEYATKVDGDKETKLKPEMINIGDIIVVRAGEIVPLDGEIIDGTASVDKKHLTGESVPVLVKVNDTIESGSVVLDSTIYIKVTSVYKDSIVAKIMNLVSSASAKKSKTETFISKFSSWYTLIVMISAVVVFGIVWLVLRDLSTAIYRGLIFLVVSCPCAFAISVPLTYFSGIGISSKLGILIKGSSYLDNCSKLKHIVFDKTGTLTTGKFIVTKVDIKKGVNEKELIDIIVAGEKNSLHPIAKAIKEYAGKVNNVKVKDFQEIAGEGIRYKVGEDIYFVGKSKSKGKSTIVEVFKNDNSVAKVYLEDEIKDVAKECIANLKSLNITTTMLTGDSEGVAKEVAKELGIDDYKSGLLPTDKFEFLQKLKEKDNDTIAFVGDGINDAPALTLSDVGISMGIMGSPATIEASDVVIADDNISRIVDLIKISKKTKKIVIQNILFACITKFTFLLLGALGITGMLLAVFADVGVTLLAILNSLRALKFNK